MRWLESLLVASMTMSLSVVSCEDCAFIPGPITVSGDTTVIKVDCDNQRTTYAGHAAITGDYYTRLLVYLSNCPIVPGRLFVNVSASLSTTTMVSEDTDQILEGTFEGLEKIAELRLEGFRSLHSLSRVAFRPLRSLERLVLVRFGADTLSSADLGTALYELSGTPLSRIVMHEIYSVANVDKIVNMTALFQFRNVTIRELTFSSNIITGISGQLSSVLPHLTYICIGTNARYYAAIKVLLDSWLFLSELTEMTIYGVPVPETLNILPCGGVIPELDSSFINITLKLLQHRDDDCFQTVKFPIPCHLKKLSMHKIMLTAEWHRHDVPICFEEDNNVSHLDLTGSVLPSNFTQITGLRHLKYISLRNTGISQFPLDFFSHFPELEVANFVQLSIGPWLKCTKTSFFGSCQTLREIHLGDCQLTTIPSSAFLHLPSLETLNLSSNSLQTFDVNLRKNTNLTHLNLSSNVISTLSQDVVVDLRAIARQRLQVSDRLTLDLRNNPLSCLCNSTQFVSQLQDWVAKQEVHVPGFEEYKCLYTNGSELSMPEVDVDQLVTLCSVLSEIKNGSDCPCDDDLRHRLELVTLSLDGYFCRNADGKMTSMANQPLPSCPDFFRNPTFIVPVVIGGVLMLGLIIASVLLYRNRNSKRVMRIVQRLSMNRIVRIGIQYVMARNRTEANSFNNDLFLYVQDDDVETVDRWLNEKLIPSRQVVRNDDFQVGLKLDVLTENIQTCRWLVPVLTQNFVDDGECRDFLARAQYSRPHAIVPVVWTPFHTDDLTISNLLENAEPIAWPGDGAEDEHLTAFWETLLLRTKDDVFVDEQFADEQAM